MRKVQKILLPLLPLTLSISSYALSEEGGRVNLMEEDKKLLKNMEEEWNRVVFELRHEGDADRVSELSRRERELRMKMDELKIDMRKKVIENLKSRRETLSSSLQTLKKEGGDWREEGRIEAEIKELDDNVKEYTDQIEMIDTRLKAEKNRGEE